MPLPMNAPKTSTILALDPEPEPDGPYPAAWRYRADPPARRVIMPAALPGTTAIAWLVTTGHGVSEVLHTGRPEVPWPWALTGHGQRGPDFIALSGDQHTSIRRIVDRVFAQERYTGRASAAALAAALEPGADLIASYCTPLMKRLAVHLGFPASEWEQAVQEPTDITQAFARTPADKAVMQHGMDSLLAYSRALMQAKLRRPDGTLLDRMISAMRAAGMDDETIVHAVRVIATASATPGSNLAGILRGALSRPGLLALIAQHPELIEQITSELVRMDGLYGLMNLRWLDRPVRLARGVTLPTDEPVIPSMLAYCRDPQIFHEPEAFDPSRPITTLPWGAGPHTCPAYRIGWGMLTAGLHEFALAHPGAYLTREPVMTAGLLPSADVLLTADAVSLLA